MSYADMAAKGPKQSPQDKMPQHIPEIRHDDSSVHSLDSLGSTNDHVQSLGSSTSSYAEQQRLEEERQEVERQATEAANEAEREAKDFLGRAEQEAGLLGNEARAEAKSTSKTTQQRYQQVKAEAQKGMKELKKEAGKDKEKAKHEAKKAEDWAEKNKRNPVVVGNAVVITALAGLLGVGAYRLSRENKLTWNVVGAWAGAVGLFAVGDYFVSSYFFKKYPPKK